MLQIDSIVCNTGIDRRCPQRFEDVMADFIRARSDEQKQQRMDQIKAATAELFQEHPYHEITLALIAEHLGWSRAALYKYVTTKEEIFLELAQDTRHAYEDSLLCAWPAGASYTPQVLAEVWAEQFNEHRAFLRYSGLLSSIIEVNVTVERLAAFKADYYASQDRLCDRLMLNLGISCARARQLTNAIYYHAIGICGWCTSNPLVPQACALAGITRRTVDFRDEMRDFIEMSLGYYTRPEA